MIVALVVLAVLVIGEALMIWALLNRLLLRAGVAPVKFQRTSDPELVEKPVKRPLFTVPIQG